MLQRCWAALYPRANFLDVLEGNPDLYGPFWIATTVVLILFLGGTISLYLHTSAGERFAYNFTLLTSMFLFSQLRCLRCLDCGQIADGHSTKQAPRA